MVALVPTGDNGFAKGTVIKFAFPEAFPSIPTHCAGTRLQAVLNTKPRGMAKEFKDV